MTHAGICTERLNGPGIKGEGKGRSVKIGEPPGGFSRPSTFFPLDLRSVGWNVGVKWAVYPPRWESSKALGLVHTYTLKLVYYLMDH